MFSCVSTRGKEKSSTTTKWHLTSMSAQANGGILILYTGVFQEVMEIIGFKTL